MKLIFLMILLVYFPYYPNRYNCTHGGQASRCYSCQDGSTSTGSCEKYGGNKKQDKRE